MAVVFLLNTKNFYFFLIAFLESGSFNLHVYFLWITFEGYLRVLSCGVIWEFFTSPICMFYITSRRKSTKQKFPHELIKFSWIFLENYYDDLWFLFVPRLDTNVGFFVFNDSFISKLLCFPFLNVWNLEYAN